MAAIMRLQIINTTGLRDNNIDNIVLSGDSVNDYLHLNLRNKLRNIRKNRRDYVHRKEEELKDYTPTNHYHNILQVLNCTLEILEKIT